MSSEARVSEAYQFKPAGHAAPAAKREYPEPNRKLQEAFETWTYGLGDDKLVHYVDSVLDKRYTRAERLIEKLELSLDEAHALLIMNQEHPHIADAGLFISALYNQLPDKNIVYDLNLDEPPDYLGHVLPADKILINRGKVGYDVGRDAKGPVINYGDAGNGFGWSAKSLVVNCGRADRWLGWGAKGVMINYGEAGSDMGEFSKGIIINCGEHSSGLGMKADGIIIAVRDPVRFFGQTRWAKLVLNQKECETIPGLRGYFDALKKKFEAGRSDNDALLSALNELGPYPENKIRQDTIEILKGDPKSRGCLMKAGYIPYPSFETYQPQTLTKARSSRLEKRLARFLGGLNGLKKIPKEIPKNISKRIPKKFSKKF